MNWARSHVGARRLDAGVVELVDAPDSKRGLCWF